MRWPVTASRRSSTRTRARSSPAPPSPEHSSTTALRSAWMARVLGGTMCSSSDCGAASSTRRSICGPTTASPTPVIRLAVIWTSTTAGAHTRALTAPRPIRPTSRCCPSARQPNPGRAPLIDAENLFRQSGPPHSTGKTTLVNALLAEVANTSDRVVLIEDTRELQCKAPNLVALRSKDGVASLSDLVRSSLRLRPDRIPAGEVRGAEALDLLKAWGTGHPGGIGTIHAGSDLGALRRLEQLIQEAVVTVPRALIAETVNVIAVLTGRGVDRRLSELAHVTGLGPNGDYVIVSTASNSAPPGEKA